MRPCHLSAAITVGIGLASSYPARAANCADVSFSPGSTPVISYDPIKGTQSATTTLNFTLSGNFRGYKTYRLIVTDAHTGTPLRIGATGPIYTVTQGGETVSFPLNSSADALVAEKSLSQSPQSLTVTLPVNSAGTDYVGGANYTENLGYSLVCYKMNDSPSVPDSGPAFAINTQIAKVLSIVTASPQTLNFGNFTTTSQALQVNIKSTSTMSVSVSTTNGSRMVLEGAVAPFPTNSVIPFTMSFGGSALAPNSSATVARGAVGGSNYAFVLALPEGIPSGKLPGNYSDVITLTIVPSP